MTTQTITTTDKMATTTDLQLLECEHDLLPITPIERLLHLPEELSITTNHIKMSNTIEKMAAIISRMTNNTDKMADLISLIMADIIEKMTEAYIKMADSFGKMAAKNKLIVVLG